MSKPLKYAEQIHAWADGAEIQQKPLYSQNDWGPFDGVWSNLFEYRVKPEIKGATYYTERLVDLQSWSDIEDAHGMADSYLCAFLEELGYTSLVREYNAIDKWYA